MTTAHRKRRPIIKSQRSLTGRLWKLVGRILLLVIGFVFLSAVMLAALYYGSLRSFSAQNYPEIIVITSSVLEGQTNPFLVIYVDHEHDKITLLNLNSSLKMSVLGGYGDYELRSVGPLLKLEKKSVKFWQSAYTLGLEQGVDGVVTFSSVLKTNDLKVKSVLWQIMSSPYLKSNLNWWQRWRLFCYGWSLTDNKLEVRNIENALAWKNWQAAQQRPINPTCSLSVVNQTNKAKLATKISRVLENSGARVVRTSTEPEVRAQTEVWLSPEAQNCEFSLLQTQHLLPFGEFKTKSSSEADTKYRGDVVILLGEDLGSLVDPNATLQ